jgi:hypothetical protein
MMADVDPGMVSLFGGETRVRTLAALSSSSQPLTGYRVTRLTGVQPTKVYEELRRLAKTGVVAEQATLNGRMGWIVTDPDVRSLFRRRVRIFWEVDRQTELANRVRNRDSPEQALASFSLMGYRRSPNTVPNQSEFVRPAAKDISLASAGLRVSRRRGRRA